MTGYRVYFDDLPPSFGYIVVHFKRNGWALAYDQDRGAVVKVNKGLVLAHLYKERLETFDLIKSDLSLQSAVSLMCAMTKLADRDYQKFGLSSFKVWQQCEDT